MPRGNARLVRLMVPRIFHQGSAGGSVLSGFCALSGFFPRLAEEAVSYSLFKNPLTVGASTEAIWKFS